MKLLVATVAPLLTVLAICGSAQARPDGTAPTQQPAGAGSPTPSPTPALGGNSASHEDSSIDNSSSGEEENITIQGKAAALCPPRQPEILALEAECAQAEPSDCSTTPAPVTETTEAHSPAAVTTTEAAAHSPTTEAPVVATTENVAKSGRRQRKRTCNYYLCVLKKLEVLDTSDMPNKTLVRNWIANNITDEDQKEKTQQKFTECVSSLKDVLGESSESSKSIEDDSTDDKKNEETQPKKKSCVAAKKVISCLSKSVECPVLKF